MFKLNMTRELDDGIKIFNSRIFKYIFHLKLFFKNLSKNPPFLAIFIKDIVADHIFITFMLIASTQYPRKKFAYKGLVK